MPYRQDIRVRYGECDIQRVVFNANYLVYCDDVVDSWTRIAFADRLLATDDPTNLHAIGFDFMLKNVNLTWYSPARYGDVVSCFARVSRWGTSSFDVTIDGSVGDRRVFDAVIVYVSIDPVTQTPAPVPAFVRESLEREV